MLLLRGLNPHSSPHFPRDTNESVGYRGDSEKNRMSAEGGISLRIHQDDFYRRAIQQISRRATAGRGTRWSSGSSGSPAIRSGRSLAACWGRICTPSASPRSATRPSACCVAPRSRSAPLVRASPHAAVDCKHATKQVDRLLSNPEIKVDDILVRWVPFVVGARSSIVVALDWTDFDSIARPPSCCR